MTFFDPRPRKKPSLTRYLTYDGLVAAYRDLTPARQGYVFFVAAIVVGVIMRVFGDRFDPYGSIGYGTLIIGSILLAGLFGFAMFKFVVEFVTGFPDWRERFNWKRWFRR